MAPAPAGLVVVDKPQGLTSHDVVGKLRRLAGTRKVGHAGTLDPLATGVLVVGVGAATRLLTHLSGTTKSYTATIRLGQATDTDDAEGQVVAGGGCRELAEQTLAAEIARLTGDILQVPASVSAIKVDGQRAYARVRQGQGVQLAARPVTVSRFEVVSPPRPARAADGTPVLDVDVDIDCSAGTYIRALARDLGKQLGCGGHLTALRRTRVGAYRLDAAHTLEELSAEVMAGNAAEPPVALRVVGLAAVARAEFTVREVTQVEAAALRQGRFLPARGPAAQAAIGPHEDLVALLRRQGEHDRPHVVFAPPGQMGN
ncbi:MAG: tRNA pseudouridine(55) synthase TruB [Buchananella hordeovulneris]|nr:tRNA pseudouridine(55) synthase TruB [Buchananella hordeovulneris]MDO5081690.1 tRNA pseudouridine(55) synthase TruB [Buchananella hordeovulneris]